VKALFENLVGALHTGSLLDEVRLQNRQPEQTQTSLGFPAITTPEEDLP
jgi:hypothetical protein